MGYVIHSPLWMANGIMLHNKTVHQSMRGCVSYYSKDVNTYFWFLLCSSKFIEYFPCDETHLPSNTILFWLKYKDLDEDSCLGIQLAICLKKKWYYIMAVKKGSYM